MPEIGIEIGIRLRSRPLDGLGTDHSSRQFARGMCALASKLTITARTAVCTPGRAILKDLPLPHPTPFAQPARPM